MPKLILNHCCCCIDLKPGCLILGYLELLGSLYYLWQLCMIPQTMKDTAKHIDEVEKLSRQPTNIDVAALENTAKIIMIVGILIFTVKLIFVIALLLGLHQDKRGPVKAYLIHYVVNMVVMVIGNFVGFALLDKATEYKESSLIWTILIITIIFVLLPAIYFGLVIRSQYYKMGTTNSNNQGVVYTR